MTRFLGRAAGLGVTVLVCSAHVGSPDAWYSGPAGPYDVLVHVQAPAVVPGIAIINIRAGGQGIDGVTAFVNKFDATGGAPPPDVAVPVSDNPGWYRTRLWVMTAGSNSVTVEVHGARGSGTVVVPLTAVAGRRLDFNPLLAGLLAVLGVILALGIFTIVGAAVRESVLPPGVQPDAGRRRRARFAMARAGVVFVLAMTGTAAWWRAEDADFVRGMFRPLTVTTGILTGANSARLVLMITDSAWTRRNDVAWLRAHGQTQQSGLIEDHGKVIHLFLVSGDGRSFAHLHPITEDTVTFASTLPAIPPGRYSVFADVVHESGLTETLVSKIDIPPDLPTSRTGTPSDSDDSWVVVAPGKGAQRADLDGGGTLSWLRSDSSLVAGEEADLRFALSIAARDTGRLEPYLGMAGHAAVVRDDGQVFVHLHPLGTISLAAQSRLIHPDSGEIVAHPMSMPRTSRDTLYFPYAFPRPGHYTVWVQIKLRGRVLTVPFAADVRAARR